MTVSVTDGSREVPANERVRDSRATGSRPCPVLPGSTADAMSRAGRRRRAPVAVGPLREPVQLDLNAEIAAADGESFDAWMRRLHEQGGQAT